MDNIQKEMDLRLEEIAGKIEELRAFANANDRDFSLPIDAPDFYCDKTLDNDSYLSDWRNENGGGAWISSSEFC